MAELSELERRGETRRKEGEAVELTLKQAYMVPTERRTPPPRTTQGLAFMILSSEKEHGVSLEF